MHSHQEAQFTFPRWPLQAISVVWSRRSKGLENSREAARQECGTGTLSDQLRYDTGSIDCRPLPQTCPETLKNQQQTLEAMWLRYFL